MHKPRLDVRTPRLDVCMPQLDVCMALGEHCTGREPHASHLDIELHSMSCQGYYLLREMHFRSDLTALHDSLVHWVQVLI